ncbi:MAG: cobalamin biosynthesis protein [Rhizobiales bacterium]|nr:cobalamin biosynthesis protein [Hyphomicrobiales bacterium]OJY06201.1 MAG: hypothetical protein BGP07_00995 [Rhizobiales bacterium 63-22]
MSPRPGFVALGVGAATQAAEADVLAAVARALAEAGVEKPDAIASLATKKDHPVWEALTQRFGCPALFFDAARLERETPRLKNPSEAVFRAVGCHGVAEAAALAAAGEGSRLAVGKTVAGHATAAVAVHS